MTPLNIFFSPDNTRQITSSAGEKQTLANTQKVNVLQRLGKPSNQMVSRLATRRQGPMAGGDDQGKL